MRPLAHFIPALGVLVLASSVSAHESEAIPVSQPANTSDGAPRPDWVQNLTMPDMPIRLDDRVIDYLVYFHDDPKGQERVRTWFERAQDFEPTIRAELRHAGLPEDLFYVTVVESGSEPRARSRKGALGLWQFVRRTAARFHLARNRWVDARIDPDLSTKAAGHYLSELYQRFGTWELALAAYNMGPGALTQAMRKYNSNDYTLLSQIEAGLPYETVFYVARILACTIIGQNRELFGLQDIDASRQAIARLELPGGIPLSKIARASGTTLERLRQLNPGLIRLRTPPSQASWIVRLPAQDLATFESRWRGRYSVFTEEKPPEAGNLETTSERQTPVRSTRRTKPLTLPLFVAVPARQFHLPDRIHTFYRVRRAQRAHELASEFGVLLKELCQWNHIDFRAPLQPGMILQLFLVRLPPQHEAELIQAKDVNTSSIGSPDFFDHHEAARRRQRIVYTARAGDTLRSLARRYQLSVRSLSRINRFSRRTQLEAGQQLVIYAPQG